MMLTVAVVILFAILLLIVVQLVPIDDRAKLILALGIAILTIIILLGKVGWHGV